LGNKYLERPVLRKIKFERTEEGGIHGAPRVGGSYLYWGKDQREEAAGRGLKVQDVLSLRESPGEIWGM